MEVEESTPPFHFRGVGFGLFRRLYECLGPKGEVLLGLGLN